MSGRDDDFAHRRAAMRARIEPLSREMLEDNPERTDFFDTIYDMASGDAAAVPWADLQPKDEIAAWLKANPGHGRTALDIACGLGDHAEAMAEAGYRVTAFDLSAKAIEWARKRFPDSNVDYRVENLLELPESWKDGFDLVNECYTIQSVPPPMHERFSKTIAGLVKLGGILLVYARTRPENSEPAGPPWPLTPSETGIFADIGFTPLKRDTFVIERPDRSVAHEFAVWKRG